MATLVSPSLEGCAALLVRHEAEVRRFIRRTLGPGADGEDVWQETCLRAVRLYPSFVSRPDWQPRPWLFRVAANLCVDVMRQDRRLQALDEVALPPFEARLTEQAVAREDVRRLGEALQSLPRRQREALVLRRIKGWDYAEVAARMGGSADTARANVYQAVKKLKQVMEQGETKGSQPWRA